MHHFVVWTNRYSRRLNILCSEDEGYGFYKKMSSTLLNRCCGLEQTLCYYFLGYEISYKDDDGKISRYQWCGTIQQILRNKSIPDTKMTVYKVVAISVLTHTSKLGQCKIYIEYENIWTEVLKRVGRHLLKDQRYKIKLDVFPINDQVMMFYKVMLRQ